MDAQLEAADQAGAAEPAAAPAPRRRGRAITGGRRAGVGRGRGRGRGQKRQREPSPPPPPPPPAENGEGSDEGNAASEGDDEYDEEAALKAALEASIAEQQQIEQAARAAAAAAAAASAAAQQAQQPAAPLDPQQLRAAALASLVESCGATQEEAEIALEEVQAQRGEPYDDAEAWADDAQLAYISRLETLGEAKDVGAAMAASLAEAQAAQAAQLPLEERPPAEVQQEFGTSQLLPALVAAAELDSLFQEGLRRPLIEFLKLEKRCLKWWDGPSGSCHFFKAFAQQALALLRGGGGGGEAAAAAAAPAAGDAGPAAPAPAAAAAADASPAAAAAPAAAAEAPDGQARPAKRQRVAPPVLSAEQAATLAADLDRQRTELQAVIYAMPAGDGANEMPALFAAAVPPDAQLECIDLLDSDDDDGGDGSGGAQQQQQQQ